MTSRKPIYLITEDGVPAQSKPSCVWETENAQAMRKSFASSHISDRLDLGIKQFKSHFSCFYVIRIWEEMLLPERGIYIILFIFVFIILLPCLSWDHSPTSIMQTLCKNLILIVSFPSKTVFYNKLATNNTEWAHVSLRKFHLLLQFPPTLLSLEGVFHSFGCQKRGNHYSF